MYESVTSDTKLMDEVEEEVAKENLLTGIGAVMGADSDAVRIVKVLNCGGGGVEGVGVIPPLLLPSRNRRLL